MKTKGPKSLQIGKDRETIVPLKMNTLKWTLNIMTITWIALKALKALEDSRPLTEWRHIQKTFAPGLLGSQQVPGYRFAFRRTAAHRAIHQEPWWFKGHLSSRRFRGRIAAQTRAISLMSLGTPHQIVARLFHMVRVITIHASISEESPERLNNSRDAYMYCGRMVQLTRSRRKKNSESQPHRTVRFSETFSRSLD